MFEQIISQLSVVAVFAQSFVDLLKPVYQKLAYQASIDKVLSIVVSIALCEFWKINLLLAAGLVLPAGMGEAFTGFVAALGSSILNQVLVLLKILKERNLPASM